MPADVIMPALGMAQETGKVLRWLKQDGATVKKGEPLLEIETDKVTVELEAPADGTLVGISAEEGDEVPVGTVIALVLAAGELAPVADPEPTRGVEDAAGSRAGARGVWAGASSPLVREVEAVAAAPVTMPAAPSRRRLASPKARKLAQERGVDLDALSGSGPNGAIVARDITAGPGPAQRGLAPVAPLSNVWRTMAERTQRAWQEVPHFFLARDVDASRLNSWRDAARAKQGGEKITHTDLLVKICAEALRRHPRVNASWRDGGIVPADGINVAIAVATDDGLVVPVVHDADRLDLPTISARRREIAEAARAGRLKPTDVQGGSFTISNLGMYGVDAFQAIVNAPQAAILAVGRIAERPWAEQGELVVRPVLTLSLSFDHRVVDGARGAEFLDTLASLVEEPAGLVA